MPIHPSKGKGPLSVMSICGLEVNGGFSIAFLEFVMLKGNSIKKRGRLTIQIGKSVNLPFYSHTTNHNVH